MVEPGAAGRAPGGAGLAHVEDRGRLAEGFQAEHRDLGGSGPVDLRLELAGVDLGAVGAGEKAAYLVGRSIDLRAALRGGAVEKVDQSPGELLGVVLERRLREQREQIRPDGGEGLRDRFRVRRLGAGGAPEPLDLQMGELELGELRGKAICPHPRRLALGLNQLDEVGFGDVVDDLSPQLRGDVPPVDVLLVRHGPRLVETLGPRGPSFADRLHVEFMRAIDGHRREAKLLPGRLAGIYPCVNLQVRPLARIGDRVAWIKAQAELHDHSAAGDPPPVEPPPFAAREHLDREGTGF